MRMVAPVLVVEDDLEIQSVLEDALEPEGCAITLAASLPDALTLLSEQLFQLVLTDLFHEPQQSPLESIQPLLVKAEPIPVGVLTGWPIPADAVRQAGAAFLLRKPFELDALVHAVQRELAPFSGLERQRHLVEQFFAALFERDWPCLARLCTPDLAVVPLSAPPAAAFGARRGLLQLRPLLEQRFLALPGYTLEAVQVFARPQGVAARYAAHWQGRDGLLHRVAGSMRFRFEGGRIAQIEGAF